MLQPRSEGPPLHGGSPLLSVIIPVYNGGEAFRMCLCALADSSITFECLVVDDGSTDDTARVAAGFGARVFSTDGKQGPARARTLGAEHAGSDLLLFIDADVCVRPDSLKRVVQAFDADDSLTALFGSYDDSPAEPDFVSQYRNLLHHFVHQRSKREAQTFWSGFGAIRAAAFRACGGFDTSFSRPAVEDIELGHRLQASGCKIILDPSLQVKHLKEWGFVAMLITDVRDRGIPWAQLILSDSRMPNDLNVSISQRVSVALAFIFVGIGVASSLLHARIFLAPMVALLFLLLAQYEVELTTARRFKGSIATILIIVSLAVASFWSGQLVLFVVSISAFLLVLLRKHYYDPQNTLRRRAGFAAGFLLICAILFVAAQPGTHIMHILFLAAGGLLVLINARFYTLLASKRGRVYAVAAIPFHILFFLYSGVAFQIALLRHLVGRWSPAQRAECRRTGLGG